MKLMVLMIVGLLSFNLYAAERDLIALERERQWSLRTDLSTNEIDKISQWMKNSRNDLKDLLVRVGDEADHFRRTALLRAGISRVIEGSFPKNTELQMRVVLHRALKLERRVSRQSSEKGFNRFGEAFLKGAINLALKYYTSDLSYLQDKKNKRDLGSFAAKTYNFFLEQGKKIVDVTAQYQYLYSVMSIFKIDLFRSPINKAPKVARIISQIHNGLRFLPQAVSNDSIARENLRKILAVESRLNYKADIEESYLLYRAVPYDLFLQTTNALKVDFIRIKTGTFTLGSPASESGRDFNERIREVTLTRDVEMMTTEVTQGLYFAVTGKNPSMFKEKKYCPTTFTIVKSPHTGKPIPLCPHHPVESATFNEVQKFIADFNKKTGKSTRLPTEAEWEVAARGGTRTAYFFGNSSSRLGDYTIYRGNSGNHAHPVGPKRTYSNKANPYGLYDMLGNVYEWTQNWYTESPNGGVDPVGASTGKYRVVRGGSWHNIAGNVRSAVRNLWVPSLRCPDVGFRLVRAAR
jgi:formylglycine-generating enzyme required for sulfatase activity